MGPVGCVCGAGRAGRRVPGPNAAGCVRVDREETTDYAESEQARLNCHTPCWRLRRP